jgi:hypothetical protein
MRPRHLPLFLLIVFAAVLPGCRDGQQQQANGFRIAVIPKGSTHEHWKRVHLGAAKAAAEFRQANCSKYDHNWVRAYWYEDDAAPLLPKGTILHVIGYFDTTSANRNVPDPRNWSGSGHRSVDNMMINLMQAINLSDEQFEAEVAKRREKLGLKPGQTVIGCPTCGAPPRPAAPATNQARPAAPPANPAPPAAN